MFLCRIQWTGPCPTQHVIWHFPKEQRLRNTHTWVHHSIFEPWICVLLTACDKAPTWAGDRAATTSHCRQAKEQRACRQRACRKSRLYNTEILLCNTVSQSVILQFTKSNPKQGQPSRLRGWYSAIFKILGWCPRWWVQSAPRQPELSKFDWLWHCQNPNCRRPLYFWGCLGLVGNDIELDAAGCQFEPYLAGGTLVVWPGMLFPNSCGYKSCNETLP